MTWPRTFSSEYRYSTKKMLLIYFSRTLCCICFRYKGLSDEVTCCFCRVVLAQWEPHDDILKEHAKAAQHCPGVLQLQGAKKRKEGQEEGEDCIIM